LALARRGYRPLAVGGGTGRAPRRGEFDEFEFV
jgi:hypothetical protein